MRLLASEIRALTNCCRDEVAVPHRGLEPDSCACASEDCGPPGRRQVERSTFAGRTTLRHDRGGWRIAVEENRVPVVRALDTSAAVVSTECRGLAAAINRPGGRRRGAGR